MAMFTLAASDRDADSGDRWGSELRVSYQRGIAHPNAGHSLVTTGPLMDVCFSMSLSESIKAKANYEEIPGRAADWQECV